MSNLKCKICGREFLNVKGLVSHFRQKHKLSSQQYYDKFLKKEWNGICIVCGNITYFDDIVKGYRVFCSNKCSSNSLKVKEEFKKTCKEKYGVEYPSQNNKIRQKQIDSYLKKYGTEHPSKLESIKKKKEETSLKRYGVKNPNQFDLIKIKKKETCLRKYGVDNPSKAYEVRKKQRLSAIKRVENQLLNGEPLMPNIGNDERKCLNELQKYIDFEILRSINIHGYFPDGYIEELNLVIEFDERHHFIDDWKTYREKDLKKNKDYLLEDIKIFRIKQKDWEQNKMNVIKDFKLLLETNHV